MIKSFVPGYETEIQFAISPLLISIFALFPVLPIAPDSKIHAVIYNRMTVFLE